MLNVSDSQLLLVHSNPIVPPQHTSQGFNTVPIIKTIPVIKPLSHSKEFKTVTITVGKGKDHTNKSATIVKKNVKTSVVKKSLSKTKITSFDKLCLSPEQLVTVGTTIIGRVNMDKMKKGKLIVKKAKKIKQLSSKAKKFEATKKKRVIKTKTLPKDISLNNQKLFGKKLKKELLEQLSEAESTDSEIVFKIQKDNPYHKLSGM